ncbi:transposase [Amycolatopsis pigmentata]|uniref:Transposase n=1 Tax=Amycolatopsis pigmentata TaxID=450801 RepID=A0ABW5G1R1_9PSEU
MGRGVALSMAERTQISLGTKWKMTSAEIAQVIGRDPSVVSREISRNGGREVYGALSAQYRAVEMSRRPKDRNMLASPQLWAEVMAGLKKKWSPRQISRRLRLEHPGREDLQVSHETIYQTLYVQAKGELRREVATALRQGRVARHSRQPNEGSIRSLAATRIPTVSWASASRKTPTSPAAHKKNSTRSPMN